MCAASPHLKANVDRFGGFAELYDANRPAPPAIIVDILTQLSGTSTPHLVVDVGSGSGLSTLIWSARAREVIGIEPGADMRDQAARRAATSGASNVRFIEGPSTVTGLRDGCADIVTVSQALHWMEPGPTFAEIARILRTGGVFAAYDCDWPPTLNAEAEMAYEAAMERTRTLEKELKLSPHVRRWKKDEHAKRIADSGRFRYVREVVLHHVESGGADRLVAIALSQGNVQTLLKAGLGEEDIGIAELRTKARAALGDAIVPWYWSYRMRLGIR
jgi:ubiquinone/menaquinone biosynthesis C-methylase UbiE